MYGKPSSGRKTRSPSRRALPSSRQSGRPLRSNRGSVLSNTMSISTRSTPQPSYARATTRSSYRQVYRTMLRAGKACSPSVMSRSTTTSRLSQGRGVDGYIGPTPSMSHTFHSTPLSTSRGFAVSPRTPSYIPSQSPSQSPPPPTRHLHPTITSKRSMFTTSQCSPTSTRVLAAQILDGFHSTSPTPPPAPTHTSTRHFKSHPKFKQNEFYQEADRKATRQKERWVDTKPPEADLLGNAKFLQFYGFQKSIFGHDMQHDDLTRHNYGKNDQLKGPSIWSQLRDKYHYYKPGGGRSKIMKEQGGWNKYFDKKQEIALRYVAVVFLFELAGEEWAVNTMGLLALCILLSFIALPLVLLWIFYKFCKRMYRKFVLPSKMKLLYDYYAGDDDEDRWPDIWSPFRELTRDKAEKEAIQKASTRGPKGMVDMMIDTVKIQQDELRKDRDVLMLEIRREEVEMLKLIKTYRHIKLFKFPEENLTEQKNVMTEQRELLQELYQDLKEIDHQGVQLQNQLEAFEMHLHNAVYDSIDDINHPVVKEIMKNEVLEIAMGRELPTDQSLIHPDRKEAAFKLLTRKQTDLINGVKDVEQIREELEHEAPYLFVRPRKRLPRLSAETYDNVNPFGYKEELLDPFFDEKDEADLKRVAVRDYAVAMDKEDTKYARLQSKAAKLREEEFQREQQRLAAAEPSELRRLGNVVTSQYEEIKSKAQSKSWWPFKSKNKANGDGSGTDGDKSTNKEDGLVVKHYNSEGKEISTEEYLRLQEEADLQFVAQIEREFSYQYNLEQKQKREKQERERLEAERIAKERRERKWFGRGKKSSSSSAAAAADTTTATVTGEPLPHDDSFLKVSPSGTPSSSRSKHKGKSDGIEGDDTPPSTASTGGATDDPFPVVPSHFFAYNPSLLTEQPHASFGPQPIPSAMQSEANRIAFGDRIILDEDLIDKTSVDVEDLVKIEARPRFWGGSMFQDDPLIPQGKGSRIMNVAKNARERMQYATLQAKSSIQSILPWGGKPSNKWDVTGDDAFDDITKHDLNKPDIDNLEELAEKYTFNVSKKWK